MYNDKPVDRSNRSMAMRICQWGGKGGVGKSTVAVNIASYLVNEEKCRVGLEDLDSQKSLEDAFKVFNKTIKGVEIAQEGEEYDVVIQDTAPYFTPELKHEMEKADFILIPCKVSPLDVQGLIKFLPILQDVKKVNLKLRYAVVLNQVKDSQMLPSRKVNSPIFQLGM